MTQQYSSEVYQFLAVAIILALGILFIRAFRNKDLPKCKSVPASRCQKDFTAIMGSIEDSTTNEQLDKLSDTARDFFKLHYKIEGDNSEVISCYTSLQNAIDAKKYNNAVKEIW